jgi:putative spermidine/putrescine transport system substrate-binding protein
MRDELKSCWRLPRRRVLAGAAGLAAPAILGAEARAQAGRVVIGTWGGDYAKLLHENVEVPLLQPQGIEVVQDIGDEEPRRAKIFAQRRLARGAVDLACTQATGAYLMNASGLLEKLDPAKIPNLVHVRPDLRTDFSVAHIMSPQVLIYNSSLVATPPADFDDLLDAKYNGKIGYPDSNFLYVLMGESIFLTGTTTAFEQAKEFCLKLNRNGLRIYPETDAVAPAFKSGELTAGVMWLARVIMWQNAGIPVKASFPRNGAVLYVSVMSIPKNAPNKEGAYRYLNAMLDPSAQRGFAARMGYSPTVDNAALTGTVAQQLALPEPAPKLIQPDYARTVQEQPALSEWWKKNISHG